MIGLNDFFKKIQNSFSKEIFLRSVISEILKKYTGENIALENISYKNGIITVKKLDQTVLSFIFTKKQYILKEISEKQDIWKVTDIKG